MTKAPPRWKTIPFQELIRVHFGVDVKTEWRSFRDGCHFGVELGIILRVGDHVGVGSISGAAVQAKPPRPVLPIMGGAPGKNHQI